MVIPYYVFVAQTKLSKIPVPPSVLPGPTQFIFGMFYSGERISINILITVSLRVSTLWI